MGVPLSQMWAVSSYVLEQRWRGRKRYPLVLMLEPLYRCNLACAGCGKIQYPGHILKREMDPARALAADEECGAPVVSIPGGEPLLHSRIEEIVEGLIERGRYVYLCTNGLLLKERLEQGIFKPSRYFTLNVHLDGDREAHDCSVCREGTYAKAEEAIRLAVKMGHRVTTNTTLFENADVARTRAFFDRVMDLGVEGMTISPGYSYEKAPDQEHFLSRTRTFDLFRALLREPKRRWKFNQSPLFLEFLMGKRHFECEPWGNPAYTIFGWQRPCYLLQEGFAGTFRDLIEETDWSSYGRASGNPRCQQCMVHCGYEPPAVNHTFGSLEGFLATVRDTLFGVDSRRGKDVVPPPVVSCPPMTSPPLRGGLCLPPAPGGKADRCRVTGAEAAPEGPLARALRDASDYRGDVTVALADGSRHVGYLVDVSAGAVELLSPGAAQPVSIPRERIIGVEKTGRDAADGRSWEAWHRRCLENRARLARGEPAEKIDLT